VYHEISVPLPVDEDSVPLREPPTRITATGRIIASASFCVFLWEEGL
jgi:hypothetical protein